MKNNLYNDEYEINMDLNLKRIWIMGDIHGQYIPIENFYNRNKDKINFSKETDCIILVGDVGANYYLNERDEKFKTKLETFPFTYFCMRGNHEERPSNLIRSNSEQLWSCENFFDNLVFVEINHPYIKYARDDVAVYNINGYKTLVIPGAYSADKYYRLMQHWNWFKDEQLTEEEMKRGRCLIQANDYKFDLILSHTCPISYEPSDLFLSTIDQSTVDKTMERYLGEIEYCTDYKIWVWGHFHKYRIYPLYEGKQCVMLSDGKEAINILECLQDYAKLFTPNY